MLIRVLILIYLLTISSSYFIENKRSNEYFTYSYRNIQNFLIKTENKNIKWYDILFIFILILLFLLFIICLYYQRPLIDFIFSLFSKPKQTDRHTHEQLVVIHRKLPGRNVDSKYLTVPQPSYLHP